VSSFSGYDDHTLTIMTHSLDAHGNYIRQCTCKTKPFIFGLLQTITAEKPGQEQEFSDKFLKIYEIILLTNRRISGARHHLYNTGRNIFSMRA